MGVASIYEHIRSHLPAEGPGLLPGGEALPDVGFIPGGERLAPGAADSMANQPIFLQPKTEEIDSVLAALIDLSRKPTLRSRRQVEAVVRHRRCIHMIDALVEAVQRDDRIHPATLYTELRSLIVTTHWREVAKLCIALLGLYRQPADEALLTIFGRHEEFTLYVTVALGSILPDPVPAWLDLAKQLDGWGKIHLVGRLVKHADRPDVRGWLLRHGCATRVDDNLVALPIATQCRLHEALSVPNPDPALLEGARRILNGLMEPGPAPGLDAYEFGPEACLHWVRRMDGRTSRLPQFLTLSNLLQLMEEPEHFWPTAIASEVRERVRRMIRDERWPALALAQVSDPDPTTAWIAREAARRLELPVFDLLIPQLEAEPDNVALWAYLATGAGRGELERLLALPLPPGGDVLSVLLRTLRRFPGMGATVIQRGLADDQAACRLLALDVLGRWPVYCVLPDLALRVMDLTRDDPLGVVRKAARSVLQGWKMPGGIES